MNLQQIEAVAQALFEIQDEGRDWDLGSERHKGKFRE
jgi:hypothetical protein